MRPLHAEVPDDERRERLRALRDEMRREHQTRHLRASGALEREDERAAMRRAWHDEMRRRQLQAGRNGEPALRPPPPPPRPPRDEADAPRMSDEERRALRRALRDARSDR